MKVVYLSFGGNVGNVSQTFSKAIHILEQRISPVQSSSSLYKTAAWGNEDQPDFLNQVLAFISNKHPLEIIDICLETEKELGRVREEKWGPRIIDIDVLFIGDMIVREENLSVPHPEIAKRRFILAPIAEIAKSFEHPILKKTMEELLEDCQDELEVEVLN